MYSSKPGKLVSLLTKKEYPYTPDRNGSSRRAAEAALTRDNAEYAAAMQARAGRPVSTRELAAGRATDPDTRSVRERVASEAATTGQPAHDPDVSPWLMSLGAAQSVIARTPAERARKQSRIDLYAAKHATWEQERAAQREHAERLAAPEVQTAIGHAQARVNSLTMDGSATQSEIDGAQARLDALQASGDSDAYLAATRAADATRLDRLRAERAAIEAQAAELRDKLLSGEAI